MSNVFCPLFVRYLKRGGTYGNKLKVPNFPMSEAGFLIWSLDQREGWATIVFEISGFRRKINNEYTRALRILPMETVKGYSAKYIRTTNQLTVVL